MSWFTKKRVAIATVLSLLLLGGTAGYAYWTAGGSGAGTADSGTVLALTVNQTSVIDDMAPGDSAQSIAGDFDNPNAGAVYVTSVTVSISSVVKAGGAPAGTCDATDYTLANAVMSVSADVPAGNGVGSFSGATLKFNNKGSNQNACKGATVNLSYAVI